MAVDMMLKLTGIEGESHVQGHENEIDIDSWAWGLHQTGTFSGGGGGGAGKVDASDFSFTKRVDKSSPTLMQFCTKGKHIEEGVLTCRKAGDNPLYYLVVKFHDMLITTVNQSGTNGADQVVESLTLNFAKFKAKYTMQNEDGSKGKENEKGHDLKRNTEW